MVYFSLRKFYNNDRVTVGHSQVKREVDTYVQAIEKTIAITRTSAPLKPDEIIYAKLDCLMQFTRTNDWKEIKVSGVFQELGLDLH